jgi:hypothetical protein
MEPAQASPGQFTRIAYFLYNAVTQQYEYFSLDTRGPQMMMEKSQDASGPITAQRNTLVNMHGSIFVAPQWGAEKNAPFRYRLTVGEIAANRQVVRLYFTPFLESRQANFWLSSMSTRESDPAGKALKWIHAHCSCVYRLCLSVGILGDDYVCPAER